MAHRALALIAMSGLILASTPLQAGQCSTQISEMEKNVTARQEGGGTVLAPPATPDTTGSVSTGTAATAKPAQDAKGENDAMALLNKARQLDTQGREAECMEMVRRVGPIGQPQ